MKNKKLSNSKQLFKVEDVFCGVIIDVMLFKAIEP
jgi:hypothetical protein